MDTFVEADAKANPFDRGHLCLKARQFFYEATPEQMAEADWKGVKEAEVEHDIRIMPGSLSTDEQKDKSYTRYLSLLFQWCDSRGLNP